MKIYTDLKAFLAKVKELGASTLVLKRLRERADTSGVQGLVLLVNQNLDSSELGQWTVMAVGPGNTYQHVEQLKGKWLHDLPSRRQYPVSAWEKQH